MRAHSHTILSYEKGPYTYTSSTMSLCICIHRSIFFFVHQFLLNLCYGHKSTLRIHHNYRYIQSSPLIKLYICRSNTSYKNKKTVLTFKYRYADYCMNYIIKVSIDTFSLYSYSTILLFHFHKYIFKYRVTIYEPHLKIDLLPNHKQ